MAKKPLLLDSRLVGATAAIVSMGTAELLAGALRPNPGPVEAVSTRVIAYAPTWFVELGKTLFGFSDKIALLIGTAILTVLVGSLLGKLARERMSWALAGIAGMQAIGFVAMVSDDNGTAGASMFLTIAGTLIGLLVFIVLMGLITPVPAPAKDGESDISPTNPPVGRRTFLAASGVVAASGAIMGVGGNRLRDRGTANTTATDISFPPSPDAERIDGLVDKANSSPVAATDNISPAVVPNDDYYRIDTSLFVPNINADDWSLTIDGLVENPMTLSYAELVERSTTIAPVTLSCVSNEVGGPLVGNAVWQGVPLQDLLEEAGVKPEASQVASYADNWSCGFPTAALENDRTALVAVGMNGEPLPNLHGFPARLVVSGLYGYVSATKWLRRIELTTLEDFDGFWIDKGWAKIAPVKTQARIDKPLPSEEFDGTAPIDIAGVAWAPSIGVERVEVQVDSGPWIEAELGESLGPDAWRQWRVKWEGDAGDHIVQVRATTSNGEVQTEERTAPAPNGASGLHARRFISF